MRKLFWLMPCLALALSAADVSGKWVGSINVSDPSSGTTINTPIRAEFSQSADRLSGKIGRRGDDEKEAIRNGKVDGQRVTFEASPAEASTSMKFDLKLEGDRMVGDMKGAVETGEITGKVQLTREPTQTQAP